MNFAQQQFLWALLVVLPAVAGLFYWSWRVKQKLMRQFIGSRLLGALTVGFSPERHWLRLALFGAAIVGIMLALARPQRGYIWEEAKTMGLDIIVAIDTSRSMLAQDVVPNRLEKSKLAVYDLMRQAKSDRLGLIVFAGTAFLQSPLTLDDQAFRQGLDAVNIGIIPQGGTALSAAIRAAIAAFEKNNDNHKVLVMFTDGEDHDADTETLAAAKEAAEAGIHIYTVGVGTPAGELLRVRDEQGNWTFVKDESGNVVKSHLNQTLLQQIATDAQGFYLPLQGANPMDTLYQRGPGKLPKSEGTTRQTKVPLERFHWPLGFAIICLILEFVIPESPRRSRRSESSTSSSSKTAQRAAATVCLLLAGISLHASPSTAYHEYQSGNFKAAAEEYNRLSQVNSNDYRLNYDAGAAAYRAKQFELAEKQFNATLTAPSVTPDVQAQEKTYYNLGNTEYQLGASLDPEKKQDRWQQAIDNYTQALQLAKQLNTNDVEAQNNLSYVQRKLEELKQQQQQQQKQDKKQNKDQKDQKDQQQDQQNGQNQDKKDQQNKQDQQQQKNGKQDQKNNQDKKQDEQKKRQQEQAKKDKEKQKQEQQKSAGKDKKDQKDQPEDQQPQEAQGQPGQMTPEEARQILASQKDDEKALIFQPTNAPVSTQSGKIKDW